MLKILHLEDDPIHAKHVKEGLESEFKRWNLRVERISTELGFRQKLDEIVKSPPRLIIMDVMLRWTDPHPNMTEPPDDVRQEGYYRAGLRCQKLVAEKDPSIPVLLYTILETADLEKEMKSVHGNVSHLSKERDLQPLFAIIRELLDSTLYT